MFCLTRQHLKQLKIVLGTVLFFPYEVQLSDLSNSSGYDLLFVPIFCFNFSFSHFLHNFCLLFMDFCLNLHKMHHRHGLRGNCKECLGYLHRGKICQVKGTASQKVPFVSFHFYVLLQNLIWHIAFFTTVH